jgi:hypothetical protein
VTPLTEAFEDLKDCTDDIARSSYLNRQETIRHFSHLLAPGQSIGTLLQELVPQVDFDAWYDEVLSPKVGMSPAARLEWPHERDKRVALQAELIRRIGDKTIDLEDFFASFFLTGRDEATDFEAFMNQLFVPFQRDIERLARPALEAERAALQARAEAEETKPLPYHFIDKQRLGQLEDIQSSQFDLQKLV